jgi:hypothetical protein
MRYILKSLFWITMVLLIFFIFFYLLILLISNSNWSYLKFREVSFESAFILLLINIGVSLIYCIIYIDRISKIKKSVLWLIFIAYVVYIILYSILFFFILFSSPANGVGPFG